MSSLINMCPCYRFLHPMSSLVGKRSVPRPSLRPPLNGGCLLFCSPGPRVKPSDQSNAPATREVSDGLRVNASLHVARGARLSFKGRSPPVAQFVVMPATADLEHPLTSVCTWTVRMGDYSQLHTHFVRWSFTNALCSVSQAA
jgi:hypothetical protein